MSSNRRFEYSSGLLNDCARSNLAQFVRTHHKSKAEGDILMTVIDELNQVSYLEPRPVVGGTDESCLTLFQQHAEHYGRDPLASDELLKRNARGELLVVANRLANLVQSVTMIYEHNLTPSLMKMSLNRFSDLNLEEDEMKTDNVDETDWPFHRKPRFLNEEGEGGLPDDSADLNIGVLTELSSIERILHVTANLGIGKGSMHALHPKGIRGYKQLPQEDYQATKSIQLSADETPVIFKTPEVNDPDLDGNVLSIKEKETKKKVVPMKPEEHGALADANATTTSSIADEYKPEDDDVFATHLNWATTENPDGVPIAHAPMDQGTCGSCWALAATGSLEASAARREANTAFQQSLLLGQTTINNNNNNFTRDKAIEYAQQVEKESFRELDLSVQELIDCDKSADQGCTGGNPLLSFYFIHRYGLASRNVYPYVGFEDTCKKDLVKQAVATVQSWGVISPNHEDHMELVLRYIGPIAVGVNGADSAFRAYSGGIFDRHHCKQGANHALLITGYSQETLPSGRVVRYWIARNSWGTDWGINGYVKMIRGDGLKGTPGVCGIARSASVALGGQLLTGDRAKRFAIPGYATDQGPMSDVCYRFHMGTSLQCIRLTTWMDQHLALVLGLISVGLTVVAAWVLSQGARRRYWRRRVVREKREQERLAAAAAAANGDANSESESTALLDAGNNGSTPSYGAS